MGQTILTSSVLHYLCKPYRIRDGHICVVYHLHELSSCVSSEHVCPTKSFCILDISWEGGLFLHLFSTSRCAWPWCNSCKEETTFKATNIRTHNIFLLSMILECLWLIAKVYELLAAQTPDNLCPWVGGYHMLNYISWKMSSVATYLAWILGHKVMLSQMADFRRLVGP